MITRVSIEDNKKESKALTQEQWDDLRHIAGRTVKSLCDKADGDTSLLVFPDSLGAYGDGVGDSVILNVQGDCISTGNLMGFVGCNQTMLRIYSRFDTVDSDYFMHYMLEKVLSINLFDLRYSTDSESVFDFILFLFPFFLNRAMAQGLFREYVTNYHNGDRVRGVIDVSRHIRFNVPFTGKVAYRTREHTADNNLIELIRHTIEYIRLKEFGGAILMRDEETKGNVSLIVESTPSYEKRDRERVINKNLRSKIHPYYSEYEPLRRICIQILRQEEIKYGEDKDAVYGVLFDGAWLWEEYLNTILPHPEFSHPENRRGLSKGFKSLFVSGNGRRYPDFFSDKMILDAKYKKYSGKSLSKVSPEDIAQVVSYMYVRQALMGGFLVPGGDRVSFEEDTLRGYGGKMFILNLPIPNPSENYEVFCGKLEENEKEMRAVLSSMI